MSRSGESVHASYPGENRGLLPGMPMDRIIGKIYQTAVSESGMSHVRIAAKRSEETVNG
jgi:hypothetical protein